MNPEDIKMGEWYRFWSDIGDGEPCTPLSPEFDQYGRMAFRSEGGDVFAAFARHMEPIPKPVVYPERWIVVGAAGIRYICDSLAEAEREANSGRFPSIGILHLRSDGTTEMLEIES